MYRLERLVENEAPPVCADCGGRPLPIVYGLPSWSPPNDAVFGGLEIDPSDPAYFCRQCRAYRADDGGRYPGSADPLDLESPGRVTPIPPPPWR